ncbi:MAG: hypothetical protein IT453_08950 [Planctomycetes bacterium]|nr:hypothetical protein [Planctomycetota bacterium]
MRAINVLLAILISVLIGLGVFEAGLRLIGKGPAPLVLEFDQQLGWKKRAELDLKRSGPEYSVRLVTNQYGLADDPMSSPGKAAGTYRVIALGDSFTQGFTVDRKDLFVDVLERWWQNEGRKVEIVNAGCEAYSTDQEVAWLLEHGAHFQPDAVAIFAYENDIFWCGSSTYEARDTQKPVFRADGTQENGTLADVGPRAWYDNSGIGLLLKPFVADRTAAQKYYFTPDGATRPISKEFAPLLATPPDFLADSVARTKGALIALKKKCDELGAKLVLVTIPSHAAIDAAYAEKFAQMRLGGLGNGAWSADKPVDTFLGIAKELGIPALDPRAYLRQVASGGQKLYYDIDWHLNPDGNRVFAHFLHDELDRQGFFPATVVATTTVPAPPDHVEEGGIPTWAYLFAGLWVFLSILFITTYPDENKALAPLKIGAFLAAIFTIAIGGSKLLGMLPPQYSRIFFILFVLVVIGFIVYKLGRRVGTVAELMKSFTLRGHWYLMPLIVVLLSIGSLLVVAASSPFVAPFIYTLF